MAYTSRNNSLTGLLVVWCNHFVDVNKMVSVDLHRFSENCIDLWGVVYRGCVLMAGSYDPLKQAEGQRGCYPGDFLLLCHWFFLLLKSQKGRRLHGLAFFGMLKSVSKRKSKGFNNYLAIFRVVWYIRST